MFATLVTVALATALPTAQSNMAKPERYTAFAIDMSNTAARRNTTQLDITITRWTTAEERDGLRETLSKGQDALLRALQRMPVVGYINTPGSLRYDLRFAWERPSGDGGRTIILATDRYINAWEAANRPRTFDYPFTVIELKVDKDGRGEGWASVATKITQDEDGTIELENFSSEPVMLNDVRPVK
jgi:hypothetical protein